MIAIETKYLAPTNNHGSRIKATAENRSVVIPYPYEYSYEVCHFQAVKALIKKYNLEWNLENMRYGATKNGYVFCFDNSIVGV